MNDSYFPSGEPGQNNRIIVVIRAVIASVDFPDEMAIQEDQRLRALILIESAPKILSYSEAGYAIEAVGVENSPVLYPSVEVDTNVSSRHVD
jgi:hypothetical protein